VAAMTSKKINAILDLDVLTSQIEELIELCERLHEENLRLKAKQAQLQSHHSRLVDRHDQSRRKIEAMIARLKTLEAEL
jgi:cell division protein ZapB